MLVAVGTPAAGWYEDPADKRSARYFDGKRWTGRSQPGVARLIRPTDPPRPRASLTRPELEHRARLLSQGPLGMYYDLYL